MAKPKVLYLSTSLNIGGTENFLVTFAEGLKAEYDLSIGYMKEKGHFGQLLEQKGFTVVKLGSSLQVHKYLKRNRFDILHTFLYRANIIGRIAGRLAGVPVIVSTQQAMDIWKSLPLVWLDRMTTSCYDAVITNSNAAKEFMHRREKVPLEKIHIIYNGIDPETFVPEKSRRDVRAALGIDMEAPVTVCVSRLHWDKGTDYLPEIARGTGRCHFLIVGDGPQMAQIKERVRTLGLESRFHFPGWRRDIPDLLAASDAFILPSREESFPQVIVEAMSMKLPIIAADIGGVRELVEDGINGLLLRRGDTEGFSKAVMQLTGTPQGVSMGNAGYKKSLYFTKDKIITGMDALYKKLLDLKCSPE